MTNSHQPEDPDDNNNRSLRTLIRAITLASGRRFSLILVPCNYQQLQAEILQRLREESPVEIREFILPPSAETLYTAIKTEFGDQQLGALMVLGLENVTDLDRLLLAANKVRDEFPKSFHFPLVLWVTDRVLKKLIRVSPDFHNWAATPISFFFTTDELINLVGDLLADESVVANGQSRQELDFALRDLQGRGEVLSSDLQANLQWVLGQSDYNNHKIDEAIAHYQESLSLYQNYPDSLHPERRGIVLCSLGLCYRRQAELNRAENLRYWREARRYFQEGIVVFEQIQRQDLVAVWIGELGEVLQLLKEWEDLQKLAEKALTLNQNYGNSAQVAQAYGFLAEVALAGKEWKKAKDWVNRALTIVLLPLDQTTNTPNRTFSQTTEGRSIWIERLGFESNHIPPTEGRSIWIERLGFESNHIPQMLRPYPTSSMMLWVENGRYLLLLAKGERGLKEYSAAIASLERAKAETYPQANPLLYIDILKELHSLYFEQKQYLKAFKIKQAQGLIESKFGLRAFIGASRLQPLPGETQETVAQEIAVSSRQEDVERLIGRIARDDCKLTVIHGQSGVGKSSLVNGGLIPALREKMVKTYDVVPISLRVYTNWVEELANLLETSPPTTVAILEQLRQNERQNLLTVLIFDQFEEFFFVYTDATTRRPFFRFLSDCLNILSVKVILSCRFSWVLG